MLIALGIVTILLLASAVAVLSYSTSLLRSLNSALLPAVNRHESESILELRDAALFTRRAPVRRQAKQTRCARCRIPLRFFRRAWLDPRVKRSKCCSLGCLRALQGQWRLDEVRTSQQIAGWTLRGLSQKEIEKADVRPWWQKDPRYIPEEDVFGIGP
jgi:hypothetical protein